MGERGNRWRGRDGDILFCVACSDLYPRTRWRLDLQTHGSLCPARREDATGENERGTVWVRVKSEGTDRPGSKECNGASSRSKKKKMRGRGREGEGGWWREVQRRKWTEWNVILFSSKFLSLFITHTELWQGTKLQKVDSFFFLFFRSPTTTKETDKPSWSHENDDQPSLRSKMSTFLTHISSSSFSLGSLFRSFAHFSLKLNVKRGMLKSRLYWRPSCPSPSFLPFVLTFFWTSEVDFVSNRSCWNNSRIAWASLYEKISSSSPLSYSLYFTQVDIFFWFLLGRSSFPLAP